MKKQNKNNRVKKLHPYEIFTFKNIKDKGLTIKDLI